MDRNSEINTRGSKKMEVALRKESVDRNATVNTVISCIMVALRKESVDRNGKVVIPGPPIMGRSPQGERG